MIYLAVWRELKDWGGPMPIHILAKRFYRTDSEIAEILKALEEKGAVIIEGEKVSLKPDQNKSNLSLWERVSNFFRR